MRAGFCGWVCLAWRGSCGMGWEDTGQRFGKLALPVMAGPRGLGVNSLVFVVFMVWAYRSARVSVDVFSGVMQGGSGL